MQNFLSWLQTTAESGKSIGLICEILSDKHLNGLSQNSEDLKDYIRQKYSRYDKGIDILFEQYDNYVKRHS